MNERCDKEWLDNELQRAICQTSVEFDAEAWKRDHADAYEGLLARHGQRMTTKALWRRPLASNATKLAAAAIVVIATGWALLATRPEPNRHPGPSSTRGQIEPSADIVTFLSLRMTYRQGGEEALNRQLDRAQEALGPRPDRSLLSDLMDDLRS